MVGEAVAIFRHANLKEQWDKLNKDDSIEERDRELVVLPHTEYPLYISVTTPNFIGRTNSNPSAILLPPKILASFFLRLPLFTMRRSLFTHLSLTALPFLPTLLYLVFIHILIFQPICFVR